MFGHDVAAGAKGASRGKKFQVWAPATCNTSVVIDFGVGSVLHLALSVSDQQASSLSSRYLAD